ncbi:hypothetical protein V2J09_002293 [Rumex salicifolius]
MNGNSDKKKLNNIFPEVCGEQNWDDQLSDEYEKRFDHNAESKDERNPVTEEEIRAGSFRSATNLRGKESVSVTGLPCMIRRRAN